MAKILIVSSNLRDWTKNTGGKERTATLAEALVGDDHEVTFLSFCWDSNSFSKKLENGILYIQPQLEPIVLKKFKQLRDTSVKQNYDAAHYLLKPEMKNFSQQLKSLSAKADIVILDHYALSPFIDDVPEEIPVIYNSHNAEITMANHLYPNNMYLISIVREMESKILNRAVATTYCSKKDFLELNENYLPVNGYYVPNGTEMRKATDPKVRIGSKNILFIGSGHPPNIVAAQKIVPLAQLLPNYNFIVCGDASNILNKDLVPPNVYPIGYVSNEDLHLLFQNSFAFINPMESGSGTHLKMMKALSYGIPIVTSEIGARGFSEKEMRDCMIVADDTSEMFAAINKLSNEEVFTKISNNAYENSKNYDWEKIKEDYKRFVESFISTKREPVVIEETTKKEKVLLYSIIRNREGWMQTYHAQLKAAVEACPEYDFYLSVYENDSTDQTRNEFLRKDWSFVKGFSFISENLNTQYFGSVKDETRVKNLSEARNKAIEAGGFLNDVDYVLMVEGDVRYDVLSFKRLLSFKTLEPDFDIVSTVSLRRTGTHYDCWATRKTPIYNSSGSELDPHYKKKEYGMYYSTSNGLCLYRAKPFQEGIRHHWINSVTGEFDCEMVVLCQKFHEKGYSNIFINYKAFAHHD